MKITRFRMVTTAVAILAAIGFIMILTFAGKKSKGPLEDFFTRIGEYVQNFEQDMIISKRKSKRADKLDWFKTIKNDKQSLVSQQSILLGAYDNESSSSYESIINLEDTLKTAFPLIQIYTAWGSKPEQQFPNIEVKTILEMGSIPVITWEPWLSDFDGEKFPGLRDPDKRDVQGMADIVAGKYDSYIVNWAKAASKINAPIFLRFGHEMNDPYRYPWGPHNNSANSFIAAFKHVHKIFDEQGANQIIWIYSPHPAYGYFKEFYPGDEFVDYVGVGSLNYGTVANWSMWWTFAEIFGNHYAKLAQFNKPIMISEFGSLAVGGNRAQWYADALNDMPQKYPLVKSVVFFHFSSDNTTTQQTLNWYIIRDEETVKAIQTEINNWKPNKPILPG